jgi:hypothetical protein
MDLTTHIHNYIGLPGVRAQALPLMHLLPYFFRTCLSKYACLVVCRKDIYRNVPTFVEGLC